MSVNEEDGLVSLTNLQKNLEREKYIHEEMKNLCEKTYEFVEASKGNARKYSELIRMNRHQYRKLNGEKEAIMRRHYEYVREFIDKKEILLSNIADIEALIFLKRHGWKGRALIHQEEFENELFKNNIPFIHDSS